MDEQEINRLAQKIANRSITAEEMSSFNDWYNGYDSEEYNVASTAEKSDLAIRMYHKIAGGASFDQKPMEQAKAQPYKLRPRSRNGALIWKVAAAVAVITLGVWLYYTSSINGRHSDAGQNPGLAYHNDVAPGKNTATLTLADGKVINLSDAKTGVVIDASALTYSDGTVVDPSLRGGTTKQSHLDSQNEIASSRSAPRNDGKGRPLSVSTPRGGQYQVVLPDGTKVWLNADSKLEFPSNFENKKQRIVRLLGEGYFEVAKNKLKPFIVETEATNDQPGQRVEVLGTHFNINSYADEGSTKTTLLEGSIRLSSLREGTTKQSHLDSENEIASSRKAPRNDVVLKPNQQATLTAASEIQVKTVDPAEAIAWKNNEFVFESETLPSIMKMVERWYDVKVVYEGDIPADRFNGGVSRFDNVSKVLKVLESTNKVRFRIEGRTIYVKQ